MHEALNDYPPTLLRPVLNDLLEADPEVRNTAYRTLREMDAYAPPEDEAIRLLQIVAEREFPPLQMEWEDPAQDLVQLMWNAPHLALVEPVVEMYSDVPDTIRRALLPLLASTRTRAGVRALVELIRKYGWPEEQYPRVFMELAGNEVYADEIFPDLLELSNGYLVDAGSLAVRWLQSETLKPEAFAGLVPQLVSRLHALLDQARARESAGISWRFEAAYSAIRSATGFLLDFLGWFDAPEVVTALERSTESADPWLALFGVTSLLRLGHEVPDDVLEIVAASHETRGHLWQYLENLGELHRYPNEWANLGDFAAFDMVQWLKHPTELGREPEELERMATFEGEVDGDRVVLYVWRFTGWDDDWLAAVSGPYRSDIVGPTAGPSTFSRFEPWQSRTAAGHAEAVLDTLDAWRRMTPG